MDHLLAALSLALLAAAAVDFVAIVRDVSPYLTASDRASLQRTGGLSLRQLRSRDRILGKAWNAHVELFPKNRKRILFAALLIAAALSVIVYPMVEAFTGR